MVSIEPGDELIDKGLEDGEKVVEVVEIADETAGEYMIPGLDQSVAEYNGTPPGEPVVIAHYNDRGKNEYAFPLSRLEVPQDED